MIPEPDSAERFVAGAPATVGNAGTPALRLGAWEGPLDLLLELDRAQRVDLAQLSITTLAEQFAAAVGAAIARRQVSERGRDFAARWAEAIFAAQNSQAAMKEFYSDVKGRMAGRGRAPEECRVLQGLTVVLGETESIAREKADYLDSLIDPELALAASSSGLAVDLAKVRKEGVADARGNQGMDGMQQRIEQQMHDEGLTFDQAVRRGSRFTLVGTSAMVADRMQVLFEARACDGFVVAPTVFPASSRKSPLPWCQNCSGAACSAGITPAERYARTCSEPYDDAFWSIRSTDRRPSR